MLLGVEVLENYQVPEQCELNQEKVFFQEKVA
jgi:hypothetical protein